MINENSIQNLAAIFKASRKFNKLQQTEVAAILEVTQGTISKIESGNMQPELGLWFKLLKTFKIIDPYCFTYGGLEFNEEVYQSFKSEGSALLPSYDYSTENVIFNVRTIRPLVDFLLKSHLKAFDVFLKDNKISKEVFYILNHPLTFDFAESFFVFLKENKINEKSISLINFNFDSSLGGEYEALIKSKSIDSIFELLSKDTASLVKYKLDTAHNSYHVILNKKNLSLIDQLTAKELIINYNSLYPYHLLKSTDLCKVNPPVIKEIKKNNEWQICYAS
jgi:DNA-binding XRE family transcriptional regulator